MSYGTPQEVATLASVWTHNGEWLNVGAPAKPEGTSPTLDEVNTWLDNVSAQFNIALGTSWFVTPVVEATSPNAYKAISQYVSSLVADLCHFKNQSGRFFSDRLVEAGITPMAAILKDMTTWIDLNADGLVADHVPQNKATSAKREILFRVIGSLD